MMKRFFVLIAVILLIIFSIVGVGFLKHKEKNIKINNDTQNTIEETQNNKEEPLEAVLENDNEPLEETKEKEEDIVKENNLEINNLEINNLEVNQNKEPTTKTNVYESNVKQNKEPVLNKSNTSITNDNTKKQENTKTNIEQPETVKKEQTKSETPKKEENKTVETPKQATTTPIREYKINQTYINKLKNTIIAEVTNNIDKLSKYGITEVNQYKIIVDSSICTCYGGNRNGWTYENVSAYNTFKSSILKGTNLKVYAVDEYQNGEYIQTLCYYGH